MILPIAPWEQKRTLLRQAAASLNAAASCLNVASRLLFKSAALQGSSPTARLPTELGRAPPARPCAGTPRRQVPRRAGDAVTQLRAGSAWRPGIPQDGTRSQAGPREPRVGDLPPGWGPPRWVPASWRPPPQPVSRLSLFNGYEGNFYKINQV